MPRTSRATTKTDEPEAEGPMEQTDVSRVVTAAAKEIFREDTFARPVIVKLARIMGELPTLKPEGRNAHFGYGFIRDTQVSGALRAKMSRERVMIVPDVIEESWVETKTSKGATSWVTKLKVRFTAIDGDSGDEVSGHGFGYGDDSGDKGANKAMTAALKYWLLKLFQIGGEDIEDDVRADQRAAARQAGNENGDGDVLVEGAKIDGIARGGRSDKMTATQKRQIFAIYKDLELTAETFAEQIDAILGDKLVMPEGGDQTTALNAYLNNLDAEDAGQLLAGLVDKKDQGEIESTEVDTSEADGPD